MPKKLTAQQTKALLHLLSDRFDKNMFRHQHLNKDDVFAKIKTRHTTLYTLFEMERTGGEPDVVVFNKEKNVLTFADCATESPIGRRSLCYDERALAERKENKPKGSALGMANEMGATLLSEEQYRTLQTIMPIDLKWYSKKRWSYFWGQALRPYFYLPQWSRIVLCRTRVSVFY
jgi:hypothetical protein